ANRVTGFTLASRRAVESQHAQGQGQSAMNLPVGDIDQFQTAAAQVAHDAIRFGDRRQHTFAGQLRLAFGAQHFAAEADTIDLADERAAIFGFADSGGGQHISPFDPHVIDQQPEPAQRGERLVAGGRGERAALFEARAESGENLLVKNGSGNARRASVDHKANRVRPDIDNGYGFGTTHSNSRALFNVRDGNAA